MGYQPKLPSVATLTLDNLIAGNYSIKLVVTDQDGATDEAVSALYVVPETDYPPKVIMNMFNAPQHISLSVRMSVPSLVLPSFIRAELAHYSHYCFKYLI